MNNRHGTRPQTATIRTVIEYLKSIGLDVYGPYADLETGALMRGNMDYDVDAVLRYRTLHDKGKLFDIDE